MKHSKVILC